MVLYGFDKWSLKLLFTYLNNRWERLTQTLIHWKSFSKGFLKDLSLVLFFFNIYLNNLFYLTESTEFCNFAADDITFSTCDKALNFLIKRMQHDSLLAIEWFQNNNMKLNQETCHLLLSGYKHGHIWAQIRDEKFGKVINKSY